MLVLVSFGLVLLATILLIVGLFNDTLGLIYLSIAASVIAAIVLFLAFRLARPKAEKGREAPEPIDPEGDDPTTIQPAAADVDDSADVDDTDDTDSGAGADDSADDGAELEPVAAAAAVPAAAAASSDDDWMDDDEWEDEVLDFPIADYDDLTVAEIMPLLPQLYSDELDTVAERERAGRNRSSIINRLDELKVSGTDADEIDPVEADSGDADPVEATVGAAAASAVAPSVPVGRGDVDDANDDEDLFPIADYDALTVGQIMPLLSQLESDELADVRDREISGAGRKTILAELDRLEGGVAAPAPAPAKKAPATKAPAKKATAKKAPAKKSTAKKSTAKKSPAKKSTKAAAKKASRPRFPIANYDELTVADIRPRLSDLSDRQLELVREREAAGAARRTILTEIDNRLS